MTTDVMTHRTGRGYVTIRWRMEEGQLLRRYRLAAGMTQTELSEAAGLFDKQTISYIECGHRHVPGEHVEPIALALGIDLSSFARALLRFQHPFLFAHIFGADRRLKGELERIKRRAKSGSLTA